MRKLIDFRDGAILFGTILLIWSITSSFVDLKSSAPESPIDQLDNSSAQVIVPTIGRPPTIAPFGGAASGVRPFPSALPTFTPYPASNIASPTNADAPATLAPAPRQAAAALATATTAPPTSPLIPSRIVIPAINLNAPVIPSNYRLLSVDGTMYQQWEAPNGYVAGWISSSAPMGVPGNTVLAGHHNIFGEVFGHLIDLQPGETIQLYSGSTVITYEITNKMILAERDQSLTVRLDNARWLLPTTDERLTLITCWPQWTNTHRLIIVAKPVSRGIASVGTTENP